MPTSDTVNKLVQKHLPGITRGLIMGALVVCVAMLLKMFQKQPAEQEPGAPAHRHSTPAPLPADTALSAPADSNLPCIVFLCAADRTAPAFPAENLLEQLLEHARGTFLIRVEKATAKSTDAGLDARAVPPAILVLEPDGSLRRALPPTAAATDILAAVGIENHAAPDNSGQEETP